MKTQGFTLVELLAVIVILAVLALIATPVVLSIIDDAKESAMLRSAEMYLSGVENAVMRENMNTGGNFRPNECSITSEGNLDCVGKNGIIEVEVNGEKPKNGNIVFENGKIKEVTLTYESGTIEKDTSGNLVYEGSNSNVTYESLGNWEHKLSDGTIESHDTESGICSKCGETVLAPGYYEDGNLVISWQQLKDEEYIFVVDGVLYGDINCTHNQYTNHKVAYQRTGKMYELTGKLVVSSEVTEIGAYAFGCGPCVPGVPLTEIHLPNTVQKINILAFSYSNLQKINLPEGIIINGLSETKLKNVELPSNITTITSGMFSYCQQLETITIPSTVTKIEQTAFMNCNSLTTINFKGTIAEWNAIEKGKVPVLEWNLGCPEITVHCTDGDVIEPVVTV